MQLTHTDHRPAAAHDDFAGDWVRRARYELLVEQNASLRHECRIHDQNARDAEAEVLRLDRECKMWRVVITALVLTFVLAKHWGLL